MEDRDGISGMDVVPGDDDDIVGKERRLAELRERIRIAEAMLTSWGRDRDWLREEATRPRGWLTASWCYAIGLVIGIPVWLFVVAVLAGGTCP